MKKYDRQHKLFWGSSYDRGLDILLFMWPDIKAAIPDAELHICYGWDLFIKAARNNPERMAWMNSVMEMMSQDGVFHHGRVGKEELTKIRKECGIWAYTTYFTEINCITALECQRDGLVPVVCNFQDTVNGEKVYTALNETVFYGVKVDGDMKDQGTKQKFMEELLVLMKNSRKWKELSEKGKEAVKNYAWANIAPQWTISFTEPERQPLVSVITPTIRKGFWNSMAYNLVNQTYKNIEWVVVDDYPEDRSALMAEVCQKYGLRYKYLRGKRNSTKEFFFYLSSANNVGAFGAEGELLVFLQDFVYPPTNGIEMLVDLYRHNPTAIIAPTDLYHKAKIEPNIESEDWFNGETNIVGDFMWRNVRNMGRGMRVSENPFEFEANYGAIPKRVVETVGGWYEFFNDGLGFDNTEFAYRALKLGSKIIVDDTNQAICIDHWKPLEDKQEELGEKRTHRLNDPRYYWMIDMIREGKLPMKRSPEVDTFRLKYDVPENLSKDEAAEWVVENLDQIIKTWSDVL